MSNLFIWMYFNIICKALLYGHAVCLLSDGVWAERHRHVRADQSGDKLTAASPFHWEILHFVFFCDQVFIHFHVLRSIYVYDLQ